jgi:hypothetical protein
MVSRTFVRLAAARRRLEFTPMFLTGFVQLQAACHAGRLAAREDSHVKPKPVRTRLPRLGHQLPLQEDREAHLPTCERHIPSTSTTSLVSRYSRRV